MRTLVLGAEGFVGGHLVTHLLSEGDEVYCGVHAKSESRFEHTLKVDITDSTGVLEAIERVQPHVVYHLAGISFVPEAEENFEKALAINVAGTANVAKACHQLNANVSLVFASSAEVYGAISAADLPITEELPVRPANNYSLSKRMAELAIERYAQLGRVRCSIARPFNHIGPGQDRRFVTASFALQLAKIAHGKAPAVLRVGNLEARRDFSDVRDIVRAYRLLASGGGGVYNLGSGRALSIQRVLDMLLKLSGVSVTIEQDPERMRGPETPEVFGSHQKARAECGWFPIVPIERSLEDVYRYWYDRVGAGLE
jgi:GDP-4-dehydro-6-deoxy-D-mannose reductase